MNDKLARLLRFFTQGDRLLTFLFLLLMLGYGYQSMQLRRALMEDVVGPKSFPLALTALALVLCAAFFFQKWREGREGAARGGGLATAGDELRGLLPLGVIVVYVLAMDTLGFILSTVLYVAVTVKLLGERTWWASALYGVVLTALVFALFHYAFEIRLPPGVIMPFYG